MKFPASASAALLPLTMALQLVSPVFSWTLPLAVPTNHRRLQSTSSKSTTSTQLHMAESSTSSTSSTSKLTTSGTSIGHSEVDMNQYNLDPDRIPEEWTASLQTATAMQEAGIYLTAQDSTNIFADTLRVLIKCPAPGEGLGIELLELAGGRGDGVGITMVSGLVEGATAEHSGLIFGDSITGVSLRKRGQNTQEIEELYSAATEALDYDGTIDQIISLVGKANEAQEAGTPHTELVYVLTIKRLRRKPKIKMLLQYPPSQEEPDVSLELFAGENLRRAMLSRGVKLNDKLSRRFDSGGSGDCGAEGTCATCAVNIVQGGELLNPIGQQEGKILEKNPRWRFACKAIVGYGMQEGEMVVKVSPRQWASE